MQGSWREGQTSNYLNSFESEVCEFDKQVVELFFLCANKEYK